MEMKYTEKQTLAEKTAQNLLEMIQEKGYGAGDKLPTEAELVETLGVGRNTVREALRILMSRNIVTIRQGSGTFISDKNGVADDPLGFFMMDDRRQLTEDLLQARLILEPALAAMKKLHRQGLPFEINTGAMSRGYRTAPYPNPILLRELHAMGGRIMINSDSHSAGTIAYAFDQAEKIAYECGFRNVTVWSKDGFREIPLG